MGGNHVSSPDDQRNSSGRDHIDDSLCSERQQPGILGAAQVISVRSTHVRPGQFGLTDRGSRGANLSFAYGDCSEEDRFEGRYQCGNRIAGLGLRGARAR